MNVKGKKDHFPKKSAGLGVILCLAAGLTLPPSLRAQDPVSDRPFDSLAKSLLVPGWGQMAEGHYFEGAIFLAAEIGCLIGAVAANGKGNRAYAEYKAAASVEEAGESRQRTERYDIRRNRFLLAAAAVWIVNLVDIYVIVRGKNRTNRNVDIDLKSGQDALAVTFSLRF